MSPNGNRDPIQRPKLGQHLELRTIRDTDGLGRTSHHNAEENKVFLTKMVKSSFTISLEAYLAGMLEVLYHQCYTSKKAAAISVLSE